MAKCGHCGKAPIGLEAKGGQLSYYVCGTLIKRGAGSCQACYVNSEKSEGLVIDKIKQHVLTEQNLRQLVRLANQLFTLTGAGWLISLRQNYRISLVM